MKTMIYAALIISTLAPQLVYSADRCSAIFDRSANIAALKTRGLETDLYFIATDKAARIEEHSIREGSASAHIYADAGKRDKPYLFFAFPQGNSGVALWFKSLGGEAYITATAKPEAIQRQDGMNGARVAMTTKSKELVIDEAVLGSMRFIRDRELGRDILEQAAGKMLKRVLDHKITLEDGKLIVTRTGINGVAKFRIELEPMGDTRVIQTADGWKLSSASEVQFRIAGMTNEKPLTPIALNKFFKEDVLKGMDPKRLVALSFLTYKEKMMAGSPRYFSKFGRDSIYVTRALMDSLKQTAAEDLLTATVSSINPRTGSVSHEQHEGDFVSFVLAKMKKAYKGVTGIIEDYKMLDDDLAFMANLGRYFTKNPERQEKFLEQKDARGLQQRDLVMKLSALIEKKAMPLSLAVEQIRLQEARLGRPMTTEEKRPLLVKHLISLHAHEMTGQWRDSNNGLGLGVDAFDVNAVFMPAALKAMAELAGRVPTTDAPNTFYDLKKAEAYRTAFEGWNKEVAPLFEVRIAKEELRARAEEYFRQSGRDLNQLPETPNEDVVFHGVSLDREGKPVPVMHSDDSLMMAFGYPSESFVRGVSQRLRLKFPYGLRTDIGILVANPIFASPEIQAIFGDKNYHGTVIWTMQEDFMVIGAIRQHGRADLPADLKQQLREDVKLVESLIHSRGDLGGIEVFTPKYDATTGRTVPVSFDGDAKGNSNQLWGHLRLVFPSLIKNMKAQTPKGL